MDAGTTQKAVDHFRAHLGEAATIVDPAQMAPRLREERGLFRGHAELLLKPGTCEEVQKILAWCHAHRVPVTPQGGNSGASAGAMPQGGIILATDRMNRIRAIDPESRILIAEAGCLLADVRNAADREDCLFPLQIASEGTCRIGGNVATNAGGANALRFGTMRNLVRGLEAVFADGSLFPGPSTLAKDNSGYAIRDLLVGSEGTLAIITAAALKLVPKRHSRCVFWGGFASADHAMQTFFAARDAFEEQLIAFELISAAAMESVQTVFPECGAPTAQRSPWHGLVELSDRAADAPLADSVCDFMAARQEAGTLMGGAIAQNERQERDFWQIREAIPQAHKRLGGSIKHDVCVPPGAVAAFVGEAEAALGARFPGFRPCPFGHGGDGSLHYNVLPPAGMDRAGMLAAWDAISEVVFDCVHAYGGSFSAEHGVGLLQQAALYRYKARAEIERLCAIKRAFDPLNILNPGKVVRAFPGGSPWRVGDNDP